MSEPSRGCFVRTYTEVTARVRAGECRPSEYPPGYRFSLSSAVMWAAG